MLRQFLKALAVAAVAAFLAAGCGSSGETSSLTKAQFIKKADAICDKVDKKQLAALQQAIKAEPGAAKTAAAQEAIIVAAALPPIQAEAEELAQLSPPSGDEEEIEAIVAGIEAAVTESEEDPSDLAAGRRGSFAKPDKLAKEYGMDSCSEVQ